MHLAPLLLVLVSSVLALESLFSAFDWMALPALDFPYEFFGLDEVASWQRRRSFGVVIDAGSSGSRALVYSWRLDSSDSDEEPGLPRITKAFPAAADDADRPSFKDISPGLSSLAADPSKDNVEAYLKPLIEFAQDAIPNYKHSETKLFLLATAGMRLIPQDAQDAILLHACAAVKMHSDFDVSEGCDKHFRIITGEDEGLYGWVAVNYLNGGFGDPEKQSPPPPYPDSPRSYGFMDMGGASTQFAFEPTEEMKKLHGKTLKHVQLRNLDGSDVSYQIFVSTFLGFGVNEARRRYVEGLAEDSGLIITAPPARTVPDRDTTGLGIPDQTYFINKYFKTPTEVFDPCLPTNLSIKAEKHLSRLMQPNPPPDLVGTGSLQKCLSSLHPYLRKSRPCTQKPCLFDGVSAPIANFAKHRFIGVSEYYYTPTSVPGAVTHGGAYRFSEFLKNADKSCKGPYEVLNETYTETHGTPLEPGSVEEDRVRLQCFKSAWVLEVLHDGFGIPREDVLSSAGEESSTFEPANELNGFKISWTLGAMLLHVSTLIKPQLP
ncbi:nucleoside phosphatase GDA1/CD39 [Rhizoclosmatium globosum]|uniref:Nucleoside phosphatase GDA1/CD39 n=1 Tax=Rhizoclosmatium globosum TaxID=329046 RepID=A0A1Y2CQ16_9FUNG|nr:nucleoside phosphatase GDA1/CD39 [Rhizoclosmatium globosum]|eukprot:ORY49047.1 nucleoside phosphatase GDA1/CD39 [Rhizoclosmatium globosum]